MLERYGIQRILIDISQRNAACLEALVRNGTQRTGHTSISPKNAGNKFYAEPPRPSALMSFRVCVSEANFNTRQTGTAQDSDVRGYLSTHPTGGHTSVGCLASERDVRQLNEDVSGATWKTNDETRGDSSRADDVRGCRTQHQLTHDQRLHLIRGLNKSAPTRSHLKETDESATRRTQQLFFFSPTAQRAASSF